MKLKELKHNHSLTDLLKVLIFSILMITPLLSVATRCLYVICNKNAYQSAEITTTTSYLEALPVYETNEVNSYNDLHTNNIYHLEGTLNNNNNEWNDKQYEFTFQIKHGGIDFNLDATDEIYVDEYTLFTNTDYTLNIDYGLCNLIINNGIYASLNLTEITFDCDIVLYYFNETNTGNLQYQIFTASEWNTYNGVETTIESTTLDNVFEYSVNKLAESPILSWTQQTAIYTGVKTMTTQLGVSTPTIAMLIVYWFLLTVIYIIIDIIIKLFTWLTHMIGSKSV